MWAKITKKKKKRLTTTSVCVHLIYLIHEFHNLSWITKINEFFADIVIYWDAPVSHSSGNGNEDFHSTTVTML